MTDNYPQFEETETLAEKNSFPVLFQLGILAVVFIGMFGAWVFENLNQPVIEPIPAEQIITDTNVYPITPQKIEQVSLKAEAAYVWDIRGQRALYSQNAGEQLPLASITKLMTALLAHELISDDNTATVETAAIKQEGSSGLASGEQFGIEQLRSLALISSSNDAAYALSASVGQLLGDQDPSAQFVKGMNIRAKELGFTTLEFKNATGLDLSLTEPGAVGSAREVSFLMEHIVTNYPYIISATKKSETRIYNTSGEYHEANNTNEAVSLIPNLIGSKTGFTDLAGGNLTVAFDAGLNRPIIVTVLGSTREDRFTDVLILINAIQESLGKQ